MEDLRPIKFLEYLEPIDGEPQEILIRSFMVKNYQKPKSLSHYAKNDNETGKLMLLDLLDEGLIEAERNDILHICNPSWVDHRGTKKYQQWFDTYKVPVKITKKGLDILDKNRLSLLISETNKATQETTAAVKKSIGFQQIFNFISMCAIVASATIAGLTFHNGDPTSLKHIDTLLQKQVLILDSIRKSQQ